MQYTTPFTCPDCGEHTFETEIEPLSSEEDLVGATCTNCGHELMEGEIANEVSRVPSSAVQKMVSDAEVLFKKYSGR